MIALTYGDWAKLLLPIAALVLAKPVGRYWRRVGERLPHVERDRVVLRLPLPHVVIAHAAALALFGFGLYLTNTIRILASAPDAPWLVVLCVIVVFVASLAGAAFFWASLRIRLEMDKSGLRGRVYLGDFRTIPWAAIASVEYSTRFKSLRIDDAAGRRVVAYPFMPGFGTLLDQLRQRVPVEVCEPAVSVAATDPLK